MSNPKTEYVLTTSEKEDARLKRQHELWLEDSRRLWRNAGLSRQQNILELGSGPGYTTLDLARYLGRDCKITAIELSPKSSEQCVNRMKEFPHVKVLNADLHQVDLGNEQYDAVFGRWIWMFLPEPEKALQKILAHLKPGGVIAFQEYVDYSAMELSPVVAIQKVVTNAVMKSFSDTGGNPNIVQKLIPMFRANGLQIEMLEPISKLIQPTEPFWDWPTQFYQTYLPTLLTNGYLSQEEISEFEMAWKKAEQTAGSFWISPTVASVIARKI